MEKYHIIGRRGAGSLIAEFLLTEAGEPYDIDFLNRKEVADPDFRKVNPLGKIPVMRCSDGTQIFETLAMVAHLIEAFPQLAPPENDPRRALHWQHLAMLATCIYPAYHRQHHSGFYIDEGGFDNLRERARSEQSVAFDYIESVLDPYLCGDQVTAADFYLYMLTRWDLDKPGLVAKRPKLAAFIEAMRNRPSVDAVIAGQKPR